MVFCDLTSFHGVWYSRGSSHCAMWFISFYGRVIFHCMDIPHLVCPFTGGHLGCFWLVAFTNSAAVSIHVLCGLMFSFSLGICLGMELLGHRVTMFTLLRTYQTVFQNSRTILHSCQKRMYESSNFCSSLPTLTIWLFNSSHPGGKDVVPPCGFDLHILDPPHVFMITGLRPRQWGKFQLFLLEVSSNDCLLVSDSRPSVLPRVSGLQWGFGLRDLG